MAGTLWLVGTPIGNLQDLSPRARQTLGDVDLIAAEDTRRTGRLLERFEIRTPLVSFFEGNEVRRLPRLLDRLRDGASIAVVTDGGMPAISDPGFRIVRACAEAGIEVRVVPGPSSIVAALAVSGLPTDRFSFEGFLPRARADRARRLADLRSDPRTLVFFESPVRVRATIAELVAELGDRRIALAREMTKLHEEVIRGLASEILDTLDEAGLKGEVVLVVEGDRGGPAPDLEGGVQAARALIADGMKKRDAAHSVADRFGVSANRIYRELVAPH